MIVVKFILKWLFITVVVSAIVFRIVRLIPGSPVEDMLSAYQMPLSQENIAILENRWGLDKPLWQQYKVWFSNFIKGDWGKSILTRTDIRTELLSKTPYSVFISLGSIIMSAFAAYILGYFSALKPSGMCDKAGRFLSLFSQTVPVFIFSVIVIYVLGVKIKAVKFFTGTGFGVLFSASFIMGLYSVGSLARVVKTQFQMQMDKTYITFAVSRGFSKEYVLFHHASKPVLQSLFSIISARMAWIWGGSVLVEFIFAIPGVSYFLIDSMKVKDYFVLQSYIMMLMCWMFLVQILYKVVSGFLMPGGIYEE